MAKAKKMNLWTQLMLLPLTVLFLNACVDKDFDLTLKEKIAGRKLMVLATLDNDLPLAVTLSSVENVDGEPVNYAVSDATVVLYENDRAIDTLEHWRRESNSVLDPLNSIYFSRTARSLTDGAAYKIVVNAPGFDEAESSPVYFEKVFSEDFDFYYSIFDSLSYSNDSIAIELTFDFGLFKASEGAIAFESLNPTRYQNFIDQGISPDSLIPIYATSQVDPYKLNDGVINFRYNLGSGMYTRNWGMFFIDLELLIMRINQGECTSVVHHTQDYLRFAEPYTAQERELIGGLSTTPAQLPNNIIGGYGYFTVRDRIADCAFP